MKTPNIEELMKRLRVAQVPHPLQHDVIDALQSQAERIAKLEAELGDLPEAQAEMLAEIKRLRAELEQIAATEPVGEVSGNAWDQGILYKDCEPGASLFTRPMPQDVTELPPMPHLKVDNRGRVNLGIAKQYAQDYAHAAIAELVDALQEYVDNDDVDLHLNGIKQKALKSLSKYKGAK